MSQIIEEEEINQREVDVKNKYQELWDIIKELEYGN